MHKKEGILPLILETAVIIIAQIFAIAAQW